MKPPLLPERRGRKSSTGRPVRQALSQLRAILDTAFQGLAAFGSAVLSKAAFGAAALGATALTAVVIGAAALGFVAGGVWGLGLASVLAAEYDLPLFFKPLGALAVALLTGFAALFAWGLLVWRGMPAARAVLRLAPLALPLVHLMAGPTQPWRGQLLLIGGLLLTVALNLRASWPAWCGAALAAVVPLAIYLPDVAPWVGRADTFEFQVVAPRLGVAHPSGYPLYIMLGKVFSLLPVGTVAWRVNLSSAVCAAAAAAALYGALRAARQPAVAALLAAWTLAFTPTLWARAVEAEVYALNALLVALVLWTAVRWHSGALKTAQALPLLGLLAGLGIAAHLTLGALLLLILPLVAASRSVRRMRRPARRTLILAAGLFVAGAALYLYIPIRWPALNNGQVMGPVEFVRFVLNAESGGALRPAAFLQDPARWGVVGRLFHMQVGWAGLALALVGFASLLGHRWPLAVGTLAPLAAWVWFGLSFYVAEPDYSAFLAPAYVVLLFWLGLGLGWLAQTLARRAPAILPLALALATLLPLSRLWLTGPMLDAEQERADDAWGRYALAAPIAPGAAILADSEKFPPLYYLQQTEGLRPDLDLVVRFDESGYREELQQRLAAGQVVYLARYLPGLEGYTLRSAGPLVEVGTAPLAAPPTPQIATSLAFGEAVRLLGFDLTPLEALDRGWRLTLLWQATAPPQGDLLVRFRLLDDTGQVLWATDGARPVGGLYSTSAWRVGEVIPDTYELVLPASVPPGNARLQLGLFPPFAEEGLPVADGDAAEWATLAGVEIEPQEGLPALPVERRALFGSGAWLTGLDLPVEARQGGSMPLIMGWRVRALDLTDFLVLTWQDEAGNEAARHEVRLPASLDGVGAFHLQQALPVPAAPGRYELSVAWLDADGRPKPARCAWLAKRSAVCSLGAVTVTATQEGLANYENLILLTGAEADTHSAASGGAIPVMLRWRSLRAVPEDYTLFVQAIGPDGRAHGQIDTWPLQGSFPTSQWSQGQTVTDQVSLWLEPDAPAGRYQMVVGWYLLATMQRLQIVDADGRALADAFTIAEWEYGG